LGDDDALMPGALSLIIILLQKTDTKAVTSIRNTYGWTNSSNERNRLILFLTRGYETRNSREWIKKMEYATMML